jgi:hypothetical protein
MAKAESAKKASSCELFDKNTQSFIYNNQVMGCWASTTYQAAKRWMLRYLSRKCGGEGSS